MFAQRTLFASLIVGPLLLAAPAHAADLKVGVFDPTRIVAESRQGQALQEELNKFRIEREGEIKKDQEDLQRRLEQYKAGVDTMSQERRDQVEGDLTQRRRDLERAMRDAEAELQRRRNKGVSNLERSVASVLEGYAERNKYTLILQRDFCAYALPAIDVSQDIVRLIDASYKP